MSPTHRRQVGQKLIGRRNVSGPQMLDGALHICVLIEPTLVDGLGDHRIDADGADVGEALDDRRHVRGARRLWDIAQPGERRLPHYLGEGFDDQRLDTLFLTMPIAWRGTLAQYAGRLHRLHDPKREVVIYDYVDRDVPVLARMAAKRAAGYSAIGYTIAQGPGLFDG